MKIEKTIGLCGTCKFWERSENQYGEIPGVGKCSAVVQFWDATQWEKKSNGRVLKKEYVGKLAFVEDGSDYYAALKTFDKFGCVQHEKK